MRTLLLGDGLTSARTQTLDGLSQGAAADYDE